MENRTEQESRATRALIAFIEEDLGDLPVKVVAGAAIRVAVALAREVFGLEGGAIATRRALENVLNQQLGTIQ